MRLFKILKKPLVTEKSANLEIEQWCYAVLVSSDATKIDIKKAIQEIYGIEVASVRVVTMREKFKFGRKSLQFRKRQAKKAYVTLKNKSDKLDLSLVK